MEGESGAEMSFLIQKQKQTFNFSYETKNLCRKDF